MKSELQELKERLETAIKQLEENESEKATYDYVIARTYSAGVFAGELKSRNGKEVELLNARRLWSWSGAASLSQLAMEGTSNPEYCKFPCEVTSVILTEVIELLPVTDKGKKAIKGVPVWKA